MTATQKYEEPKFTPIREFITDSYGEVKPKIDVLQAKAKARAINTAHDTETNIIATGSMISGKKFVPTYINISNRETYNLRVEIFDDTTLIDEFQIGASESIILLDESGLWDFSTEVNFKTQSGTAFSAGTSVSVNGVWLET